MQRLTKLHDPANVSMYRRLFSGIYDCEQAYDKAFRRMEAEDRAQLAEKYVPKLEAKAAECAAAS